MTKNDKKKIAQTSKKGNDTTRFFNFQLEWKDDYCLIEDIDQDVLKKFSKLKGLETEVVEHTLEKRQDINDEKENNEDCEDDEDDKKEKDNDDFDFYDDWEF